MVRARFLNDVTVIDVTSTSEVKRVKLNFQEDHNSLIHRDSPDQHPISAITGLQDAIDTIPDDYVSDAELESALLGKQDVISDLATIRSGAALGATAVQPNDLNYYATIQYVDNGLSEKQDTLTAGANIQIVGNTISATDTTYTAGNGISIIGNVITNTQTSAEWGNIIGTLSAQTDLWNILNAKANVADIPTTTSDLTNDSGFITSSALTGYATQTWVEDKGYLTEIPAEYVTDSELTAKGYQTAADVESAITAKGYTTMSAVEAKGYITSAALVGYATESYVTTAVGTETTNRQNADNNLQSQIDAITASSDVTDIVGTYAQLQAYDTSTLAPNSIIKVLQDESQNNETTYYRWVITGGVGAWSLIGEEGPYYTISAADAKFATQTALTTGLAAKQDVISDLATIRSGAALGATAVQPADLATAISTKANDSAVVHKTGNETVGGVKTFSSDMYITNNQPFLYLRQTSFAKGDVPASQISASVNFLDSSEVLSGAHQLSSIGTEILTSGDIRCFLRAFKNAVNVSTNAQIAIYYPVSGNPYTECPTPTEDTTTSKQIDTVGARNTALSSYVLSSSLATVATSGSYNDLTNKPTIPTDTSDLTNGAEFITSAALAGYATETWVGQQGYITGITSSDVTTALGYTPYDASNPSGYTSNVGTVTSVNNVSPVSGNVTISIPTDTGDLTNNAGFITSSALAGYATETWVGQQGYITSAAIANMQTTGNLVTAISSSSTDTQYPSAKCVYDIVGDVETLLSQV